MKKLLSIVALAVLGLAVFPQPAKAAESFQYVTQVNPPATTHIATTHQVSITIKNTGSSTWLRDSATPFRLGTPNNTASLMCVGPFYTTGWLPGCNRIQLPVASVAPGATVTIPFTVGTQDYGGRFTQYFRPVIDGVTWLQDIGIYMTTLAPAPPGILFFTWYGPEGHRWDTGACDNPCYGTVVDTPAYGYYDSADATVRRVQLQAIQEAGIEYVILDYWVNGVDANTTQANAFAAAAQIRAEFPNLKYSFLIESPDQTVVPPATYNALATQTSAQSFTYMGQPVLYTYGIIAPQFDNRFTQWWWTALNGGANTAYWVHEPMLSKNNVVTPFGSFDPTAYDPNSPTFDKNQTGSLWASQFATALNVRDYVKLFPIYGWNEFYERAAFEPHIHYGTTNAPDKMYQLLKSSMATWKQ